MGVENQINRHNLIALIMFGQKRFEGEMDSINAKIDTEKLNPIEMVTICTEHIRTR